MEDYSDYFKPGYNPPERVAEHIAALGATEATLFTARDERALDGFRDVMGVDVRHLRPESIQTVIAAYCAATVGPRCPTCDGRGRTLNNAYPVVTWDRCGRCDGAGRVKPDGGPGGGAPQAEDGWRTVDGVMVVPREEA